MRLRTLAATFLATAPLLHSPATASDAPATEVYAAWSQVTGSVNAASNTGFTDLNLSIRFIMETGDGNASCPDFSGLLSRGGPPTSVPLSFVKRTNSPDAPGTPVDDQRFPIIICEAMAPNVPGTLTLMDGDTAVVFSDSGEAPVTLPLAPSVGASGPPSFVVFGDTGCRGIGNHRGSQDCTENSTSKRYTHFRFKEVAQAASKLNPDFVVHLGDYRYDKERDRTFDNWDSDFFERVRLGLLTEVPWVFVRGNHEECSLAGRGWFYFFAPDMGSCVGGSRAGDAWHFDVAERNAGMADPHRFIVIDTSSYLSTRDTTAVRNLADVMRHAQDPGWPNGAAPSSWLLMHKPLWAVEDHNGVHQQDKGTGYFIQDVMRHASISDCTDYDAARCTIKAVLAAHLHILQNVVTVDAALPQQYVVGNSGVRMDHAAGPEGCQVGLNPWGMADDYQTGIMVNARGRTHGRGNDLFGFAHFVRDPGDGQSGWKGRAYYLDTPKGVALASSKSVSGSSDEACLP